MSKKNGKYLQKKKKRSRKGLKIAIFILVLLLAAMMGLLFLLPEDEGESAVTEPGQAGAQQTDDAEYTPDLIAPETENMVNLGYGLYALDIGKYTGVYMEDCTDEVLSNILMLMVQNNGEQDIQFAQIIMQVGDETAQFQATTIPVGARMVLLEQNRMTWDETADYSQIYPMVENMAYFQEPVSTHEDQLKIGIVDGAINVTNISGADIPGTITVYYKNAAQDVYYGGITYRITVEGGLKADEIRQVMTNHASDTGSKIMFVTVTQ